MMETIQDVLQLILQADDIKYVKNMVFKQFIRIIHRYIKLWTGFETGGGT